MNDDNNEKKIKDYIYCIYKRKLITFQRYVHKLGLIENEDDISIAEVSNSFYY